MHHDECADPAIGVGAADNCQNRKQQHVWQLIALAFSATWVRDCREERKETFERPQGNLQMIWLPHIDSDFFDPRNPPFLLVPQIFSRCCNADSVERIKQPCRAAPDFNPHSRVYS